jgi:hypothetical protein
VFPVGKYSVWSAEGLPSTFGAGGLWASGQVVVDGWLTVRRPVCGWVGCSLMGLWVVAWWPDGRVTAAWR